MLKELPGCFEDLFCVWNVSYGCHLLVLSARCFLCNMWVLAALPHLQTVVDHGHSLKFSFLHFSLHFGVVFCVCHMQCWVITSQHPIIGLSKQPNDSVFLNCLSCGFWLFPANNILPKGKTCLHSDTMWYYREYVPRHIQEIGVLWVHILLVAPPVLLCPRFKMYCWSPLGLSGNDWDLDLFAPSSLVLLAVNSNRSWRRSISMLHDRLPWVLFQLHYLSISILHHRWTNHTDERKIDLIIKQLQRGQECLLVCFRVYWPAHVHVWHSIHSPHIFKWPLGIE